MSADNERQQGERLYAQQQYVEAERHFRRCVALAPDQAITHYNLGVVLAKQKQHKEAINCFTEALKYDAGFAASYTNLGFCLHETGNIRAAKSAFALAHHIMPDDPVPKLNEGLAMLTLGEFHEGWRKFEARGQRQEALPFQRTFTQPLWHGAPLKEKTILLHAEEGFGDSLHMARYAPLLEQRGAKVIVEIQPSLATLFSSLSPTIVIVKRGETLPDFDYQVPMLSVPIGFDTTLETIPATVPYIFPKNDDVNFWIKHRLKRDATNKTSVGLAWAGRPSHERDHQRSLKLTELLPLLNLKSLDWVSLQHPLSPADQALFTSHGGFVKQPVAFRDFAETAALVMTLDLVITVDTAIAHLAGALGKAVWLLLPYVADWRWLLDRNDSPWYPTMHIFRQKKVGEWESVIHAVRAKLQQQT